MGTETDPLHLGTLLPLSETRSIPEGTLGFAATKSGREFLRRNFKPFLVRSGMGVRKVATVVADVSGNTEVSFRDAEQVRTALKRWDADTQKEIFVNDPEKNYRIFVRLEREMMSVREIREVLSDTAQTDEKIQIGEALARYYYRKADLGNSDFLKYLHAIHDGIFIEHTSWEHPIGVGTEQYQFIKSGGNVFYRLQSLSGCSFMLAQRFMKPPGEEMDFSLPGFVRSLHNGFAFPMESGDIHLHLFHAGPKYSRRTEVLEPGMSTRRIPVNFDATNEKNRTWRASYLSFAASFEVISRDNEEVVWEHVGRDTNVDKLLKNLDSRKWIL